VGRVAMGETEKKRRRVYRIIETCIIQYGEDEGSIFIMLIFERVFCTYVRAIWCMAGPLFLDFRG
jgi:hypothetical protein